MYYITPFYRKLQTGPACGPKSKKRRESRAVSRYGRIGSREALAVTFPATRDKKGGGEKAEEEGERKGRRRKERERLRIPICVIPPTHNIIMSCADPSFLSHISFP
jgi:hypothetical protein